MADHRMCQRFGLHNGQYFAEYELKNQWWYLNGNKFGFGDLRTHDIIVIMDRLEDDEVFEGFNEHHMSRDMHRENATIRITNQGYERPEPQPVTAETRSKITS